MNLSQETKNRLNKMIRSNRENTICHWCNSFMQIGTFSLVSIKGMIDYKPCCVDCLNKQLNKKGN